MRDKDFTFEGFDPSNSTCVPDVVFDVLLPILTGAELKVLLYIIRRTLGFKKGSDTISLNQFHKGIKTKDGKQLDNGCGVSDRTTLVQALNSLEKYGCIERTKTLSIQGDSDTTVYSIHYLEVVGKPDYPTRETRRRVVGKPDDGGYGNQTRGSRETRLGVVGKPDPQLNSNTTKQTTTKQTTTKQTHNNAANADVNQTRRGKNTTKKKFLSLETFDLKQETSIETIMELGDIWRGTTLPVNNRADSDYTKALTAATTLSQRLRGNNLHGYSLEEINTAYKFFKRIGEPGSIAEDWWKGKNVDLWVIAKNIDKALDKLNVTITPPDNTPALEDDNKLILFSEQKFKEREAYDHWFMFRWMTKDEALRYGLEDRGELTSTLRNEIANMLDIYQDEIPQRIAEYTARALATA